MLFFPVPMAKDLGSLPGTQHECRRFPWALFQWVNLYFPSSTFALCCPGRPWALPRGDHHSLTGSMVTSMEGPWLWLELWDHSIMKMLAKHSVASRRSWFTVVMRGHILHISFTALCAVCSLRVRSNLLLWLGRERSTSEKAMGSHIPIFI